MRNFHRLTLPIATAILLALVPAAAHGESEEHCVVVVVDQAASGELITTKPECFDTYSAAVSFASAGAVALPMATKASITLFDEGIASILSTFTLGTHYDGLNGTGSSISVVGSSCSGGYWNTPSSWDNRISSTWNGCNRLVHYDYPNRGGSSASTWGVGDLDNVPSSMNNKAESVSYSSS
jgi:hypothetical protein